MKTAVVQIDRAGDAEVIITQDGLGMQEPGQILEDFDPGGHQPVIIGPGDLVDVPFVPDPGRGNPDIDAAQGGLAEGIHHEFIDDQIRCGDVDIVPGAGNDLAIDLLGWIDRIVDRTIGKRLEKPAPRTGATGRYRW